jgi:beta-N-acetylhexosaminidase
MNTSEMKKTVDALLGSMSVEQKVGQMLCLGFCGSYPHPDILEAIRKIHPAGFRVTPYTRKFKRYFGPDNPATARVVRPPEPFEREYGSTMPAPAVPARRYAEVLNTLRRRSLETGAGIPLYFALDYEGNQSFDFNDPDMALFPAAMGLAASGDPALCRRVARTIGEQLRAVGINWLHSPVLDVNTAPMNPEIGTRSYSPLPDEVSRYAAASLAGFDQAGVIATGKHFPGRGHSVTDVHFGIASIEESRERMSEVHLAPYKALIAAGLPAIMLAHSIFPGIDPESEIATLSKAVIHDVLRGELGFDGVIMTDSFTMGGLVAKYEVAEAAIRCIVHGVDLILLKDENALRGEVFEGLVGAVRSGRISGDRLDEAVRHVLTAKGRAGLFGAEKGMVDPDTVETRLRSAEAVAMEKEAAQRCITILRDGKGLLPLPRDARVLVAEEVSMIHKRLNNHRAYAGALFHGLIEAGYDAWGTDFECNDSFENIWPLIRERAKEADVIVHTGFFERGGEIEKAYHKRFLELGKPTLFVTNCPYGTVVDAAMETVVVTFSPGASSLRAAARVLTGDLRATAKLGFDPGKAY